MRKRESKEIHHDPVPAVTGSLCGERNKIIQSSLDDPGLVLLYRNIIDHTGTVILVLEADRTITLVNSEFERVVGYSKEEVEKKKKWSEFVLTDEWEHPEDPHPLRREDPAKSSLQYDIKFVTKTGEVRHGLAQVTPVPETRSSIVSMIDVTDRVEAEKEKERMQNQLLHAQKMEGIGILAGGIAHDFNNLLTAIQGCCEMMKLNINEGHECYQDIMEIQGATTRAADLTRQLLLFSRKNLSEPVPLDMNRTIESMLQLLHRLIGEDIHVHTDLDQDLWPIRGDRITLEQVILNLVVNARDAMPEGGDLWIMTRNKVFKKENSEVLPHLKTGKHVRLIVKDTGVGICKVDQRHIFEPFFSTKKDSNGTGLGLSVVNGVVKQHKGTIRVKSAPGKGATFEICFPAIAVKPEYIKEKDVCIETLYGTGEKLLIVEDDEYVREFTMRALNKSGFTVLGVSTAQETRTLFRKHRGQIDIIFSDVVLPDGTGLDLVEELKNENPDLRVLLSSGYSDHKSKWPLIIQKGYAFIEKPYSLTDLLQAIQGLNA